MIITFDSNAYYSEAVAARQAALPAADAPRAIMLAASTTDPKGLVRSRLPRRDPRIAFDPTKLALPLQEVKRAAPTSP